MAAGDLQVLTAVDAAKMQSLPEKRSLPSVKCFAECFFRHSAKSLFAECFF
jgi:hypothetical protein